jgi:DNA-binding NtrC family response regulator
MSGEQNQIKPDRSASLIFVVDDAPLIGEVVEAFLKIEGYPVRFFENPEVAWKAFCDISPKPKMLITDYAMEPFHGIELIGRCLKIDPGLKTILISGNVTENIVQQFPVRPDYFMQKPFKSRQLLAAVAGLLAAGHYNERNDR